MPKFSELIVLIKGRGEVASEIAHRLFISPGVGSFWVVTHIPLQRYFHDGIINHITEGTMEIQQLIIARSVVSQVNLPPIIKLMFHPFSQVNVPSWVH